MFWWVAGLYDRSMRQSEEACLDFWRTELLRELSGEVLEIGAGTGASLPRYPKAVTRLVLCEPDKHMRRKLQARVESLGLRHANVLDASLDDLPVAPKSFDAVVCSLVLCSVSDQHRALSAIMRVLKPHGRLVFLEHVAADNNPRRLRWQRHLEPIWKRFMGNCHLARRTESAILGAGFEIEWIKRESIRKALPIVRPSIRGVAQKAHSP
jgi:ubiquinone/menaquinone biosynthesis C-methylase UbiE